MAPRILGPRRTNISAPHSRTRTATLSCEVISLGATQVQWLRQVTGKGEADDDDARAGGRKTVVVFDYVFEVRDHLTHQKLISIGLDFVMPIDEAIFQLCLLESDLWYYCG